MLRTCCRIIALTAMVASPTAQAADTTLTLACQGIQTSKGVMGNSTERVNIGIIVDFQKKVVLGLSDETPAPVRITSINETTISFTGKAPGWFVIGALDRVTGALDATWDGWIPDTRKKIMSTSFDLKCKPTQRMF